MSQDKPVFTLEQIWAMSNGLDDAIDKLGLSEKELDVLYDAVGNLRDLALSGLDRQGWISVEERLPTKYETVLMTDGQDRSTGFLGEEQWRWDYADLRTELPTHWSPLRPAPHASGPASGSPDEGKGE